MHSNPDNNFRRLLEISVDIVRAYRPGRTFIADDFHTAINRNPALRPNERRVMGAVMKELKEQGLTRKTRIVSSPNRSHGGNTTEWARI